LAPALRKLPQPRRHVVLDPLPIVAAAGRRFAAQIVQGQCRRSRLRHIAFPFNISEQQLKKTPSSNGGPAPLHSTAGSSGSQGDAT
jgi:hypothetical protein